MKNILIIFIALMSSQTINAAHIQAPTLGDLIVARRAPYINERIKLVNGQWVHHATLSIEHCISRLDGLEGMRGVGDLAELSVIPFFYTTQQGPCLHVSNRALSPICKLKKLSIYQPIAFEAGALAYLRTLTSLSLHFAGLNKIPDLSILDQLKFLSLQHNKIASVQEDDLKLLRSSLRELDLSYNGLQIGQSKFVSQTLETLVLSNNNLSVLGAGLFVLPHLNNLHLSQVGLEKIKKGALGHLTELEELDIDGNELAIASPSIALKMWGFNGHFLNCFQQKVTTRRKVKAFFKEQAWRVTNSRS